MARVNVEENFLSKVERLGIYDDIAVSPTEIIGSMVLLWHVTQDRGLTEVTLDQFSLFTGWSLDAARTIVNAMVNFGILSMNAQNIIINGNAKHIEHLQNLRRTASKAGVASGAKRRIKSISSKTNMMFDSSERDVQKTERNAIQCNSMQLINNSACFDFESLYQKYPNKRGKQIGMERCNKEILKQEDYDSLSKAIDNYAAASKDTEPKFVLHFSTFMSKGRWRDYAECEDAKPKVLKVLKSDIDGVLA